jgi:hypothetical protein
MNSEPSAQRESDPRGNAEEPAEPVPHNPLWVVAIGMAVLFGSMAAIIVLAG